MCAHARAGGSSAVLKAVQSGCDRGNVALVACEVTDLVDAGPQQLLVGLPGPCGNPGELATAERGHLPVHVESSTIGRRFGQTEPDDPIECVHEPASLAYTSTESHRL